MKPPLATAAAALRRYVTGEVRLDYPLAHHTTYGLGGPADLGVLPASAEDMTRAIALLDGLSLPYVVLGGGSNVLVSDAGVRGVVLLTSRMQALRVNGHKLYAEAGVDSHRVALSARDAGLTGAEFLCCLPGSIGGACYMNARAYGGEVSAVITEARVVSPAGEAAQLRLASDQFSYKRSPFQDQGWALASVTLTLEEGDPRAIQTQMDAIERERRLKREMDFPSCGCVFKNDYAIGVSSGKLIESCGLKGYAVGAAQVSPYHANFIIDTGGATATQVRAVIQHVQERVAQETGHHLELEVQLLGEWDELPPRG